MQMGSGVMVKKLPDRFVFVNTIYNMYINVTHIIICINRCRNLTYPLVFTCAT